ncbi:hypothetical protein FHG87_016438 [Trinorchestia longiramus]|nr:hypothetical protein FHG87_016438 [Trinorchestia longiramus]
MNGPWAKVNGRRMIEKNGINDNERNRINEKMSGPWIKVGGRRINEIDAMKGEHEREKNARYVRMSGSSGCTNLRGKRVKEICENAEKVIDDMNKGMVIVQGGGNGLLENGRKATVNAIMKEHERRILLDMDDLILAGVFFKDGVHLLQQGETKLSQRFIHWIRATHLLMESRMD